MREHIRVYSLSITPGCTAFLFMPGVSNAYRVHLDFVIFVRIVLVVLLSDVRTIPKCISSEVVSS